MSDDEKSLEARLRERAPGPPQPPDSLPWEFLLREDPAAAWPVVSRLLEDADPVVRLRALEFVMIWRDERTLPRLLEVARAHAALFADQIVDGVRLRERLQHALANRARAGTPEAALLIDLLDDQMPSVATGAVIGAHDPKKAAEIGARLPANDDARQWLRTATAAVALYRRDQLIDFLRALVNREERELLASEADQAIERDDTRAEKITRKNGLPPPAHPAPTLEEIRRALALS